MYEKKILDYDLGIGVALFLFFLNERKSKLRRLNNGLSQGSVLAPILFDIYTHDMASIISKSFLYDDDLTLLVCKAFRVAEISKDYRCLLLILATESKYI